MYGCVDITECFNDTFPSSLEEKSSWKEFFNFLGVLQNSAIFYRLHQSFFVVLVKDVATSTQCVLYSHTSRQIFQPQVTKSICYKPSRKHEHLLGPCFLDVEKPWESRLFPGGARAPPCENQQGCFESKIRRSLDAKGRHQISWFQANRIRAR